MIARGDDDRIIPIGAPAMPSSKIVKNATLKVCTDAPLGLASSLEDTFNADLLAFVKA